jgi:hypothetical protein
MSDEAKRAEELRPDSKILSRVWWQTLDGRRHEGTLVDWDNGTAIIQTDTGTEIAVRAR